jgi:hypothetical protein
MNKQTYIAPVAGQPKATLTLDVIGKVEFRGILDRQHMPVLHPPARRPTGCDQHLGMANTAVIQEAAKGERLKAVIRQGMDAHRWLLAHSGQQPCANPTKPGITKTTKIVPTHANRPLTTMKTHRIRLLANWKVDSEMCERRRRSGGGGERNEAAIPTKLRLLIEVLTKRVKAFLLGSLIGLRWLAMRFIACADLLRAGNIRRLAR